MKTLNLLFALSFSIIASLSFASNGNFFVVEQEGENFVMYLNVDANEVASVKVEGNFSNNGVAESLNIEIPAEEVKNFNHGLAKIQSITPGFEFASYTLTVTTSNGEVLSYPSVVLQMDMFDMNLAKN